MEASAVSQRLNQFLNEVDLDIKRAVHKARLTQPFVLVLEWREEGEDEGLESVLLETVEAAATRHTLDKVLDLR